MVVSIGSVTKVGSDPLHTSDNCHTSAQIPLCPKLPSSNRNHDKRGPICDPHMTEWISLINSWPSSLEMHFSMGEQIPLLYNSPFIILYGLVLACILFNICFIIYWMVPPKESYNLCSSIFTVWKTLSGWLLPSITTKVHLKFWRTLWGGGG
jgi:hypothetical protein